MDEYHAYDVTSVVVLVAINDAAVTTLHLVSWLVLSWFG